MAELYSPPIELLERTRPLSDKTFRVLLGIQIVTPPQLIICRAHDIAEVVRSLPRPLDSVLESIEELERHGWLKRRETAGRPMIHLLYRATG